MSLPPSEVDYSSLEAPAEPMRIALPQPSDASMHIPGNDEEQRSICIAAARGGDSEALILKAGGVNEASQVLGAQSRPSSWELTLGSYVNSFSSDSVKVLFDGSLSNAGGSMSANGGPEASIQPPVFRSALPLNRHTNEGNSTPVRRTINAGFLPQSQVGGNRHRFNSNNGHYRNRLHHERGINDWNDLPVLDPCMWMSMPRFNSDNGHYRNRLHHKRGINDWNDLPVLPVLDPCMWMSMPQLQGHGQQFIAPCNAFIPHQAPPFASPIGYTDDTSPYYGTPPTETYYAPPPPFLEIYYARPPPPQQFVLKQQIEYYFSVDNLYKDFFLRSNMNAQGWVHISLIATFRRVKSVTSNTNYILSALRSSTVIEIQGENIRRRNDWKRWILPLPSGSAASISDYDSVVGDSSGQSL